MRPRAIRPMRWGRVGAAWLAACVALSWAGTASAAGRQPLVVGGDHENPPYEYLDGGRPTGFNVDLMRAVASVEGLEVDIRLGPWSDARRALEEGRIDALSGMYYSKERSQLVGFSVPHTMVRSAIFVREDSPIRSYADLRGKEVILQDGDVLYDLFKRTGLASRILAVTDPDDQLKLLASGRGDCALMASRLQGEYYVKRLGLTGLRIIDAELPQLRYCFAVHRGNRELLYRLDEGLNILKVSGKYQEIYERWFGVYERSDRWRYGRIFAIALAVVTGFFVASLLWSWSLRRQVRARTSALQERERELELARAELERRVEERTADLRRANEQLRVSEAEKAVILNSTADLVTFQDPEMRIQWGNQQAADLAGTSLEGLRGRHCYEAFHQRSDPCPGCPTVAALATGEPVSAELPRPGGRTILQRAYPVKGDDGRLLGAAEFTLDITNRKRMEEALRESRERYARLAATVPGVLYEFARSPDGSGRFTYLSPRCPEIFEVDGRAILDDLNLLHGMMDPPHERALQAATLSASRSRTPLTMEVHLTTPSGRSKWIQFTSLPASTTPNGIEMRSGLILDVTDRKGAEEALRESEERFHTLADNIAPLAWMAAASGEVFWFNRRCLDYTGATPDALELGRFIHPDHVGRVAEKMSRSLSTGAAFEDTFALRGRDGRYRWFLSRTVPVHDAAGRVERWFGTATDVTELREVEDALRESEARGRAILASLAEGVVFTAADGVISSANDAALALLGLSREELTGRSPRPSSWCALRPDGTTLPVEEAPMHVALRTGRPQRDVEVGVRRPDGTVVWVSINAEPVRLSPGATAGVVVSLFDITQRRQALQRSQEHLRTMADSVPDAIVRFDRGLRLVFANAAAAAALGAPLDRVLGKTRAEMGMPPEHVAFWNEYLLKVFRTGSPDRFEFGLDSPSGRHFESRLVPERDRDGSVESVLSITRDITERKQAEEKLLASREQLRALVARLNSVREEEKARLSRELHDEMGQLLTGLRMELEALEDGLGEMGTACATRELVDRAVAASELVARAIDSMHDLLASLRPVALDRLGLSAALRQECRKLQARAGVSCGLAAVDDLSSFGSEVDTALFRIAQEALTNVIKHARASRATVSVERRGDRAMLRVVDDGRGIPPGRESAGLGVLGMRERAERLGGDLVLYAAPRGGTVVEARIPLSTEGKGALS